MAVTLSITVTDAQSVRALAAFGRFNGATPPVWVPATGPEVRAIILNFVRAQVQNYEARLAAEAVQANVGSETW